MIGLKLLSQNRQELYASNFSLDALKPYLLDYYREAYATIVLYEDNAEVYHETGIYSFDASEPETFNYEEFQAPLLEEFNDRVAVCTVENLFLHLERFMEDKPMEDDPFKNLVFSISLVPPSRELLLDWEKNIDKRLKRVLYDKKSEEHFQLFPNEVCVVYSHDNYFTSVTSAQMDLIQAIFEDVAEKHLAPITNPPLPSQLVSDLFSHTQIYGAIRLKPDRIHTDVPGQPFMLVTYPQKNGGTRKLISRLALTQGGEPLTLSEAETISRIRYHLRYSDLTLLPMILFLSLMSFVVIGALYLRLS